MTIAGVRYDRAHVRSRAVSSSSSPTRRAGLRTHGPPVRATHGEPFGGVPRTSPRPRVRRARGRVRRWRRTGRPADALRFALGKLGTPYEWGGEGPYAFDCSGLVQAAYADAGIWLPRVAQQQFDAGPQVPPDEPLQPGDLVFFGSDAAHIVHVGMVSGPGLMVDAPYTGTRRPLRLVRARRVRRRHPPGGEPRRRTRSSSSRPRSRSHPLRARSSSPKTLKAGRLPAEKRGMAAKLTPIVLRLALLALVVVSCPRRRSPSRPPVAARPRPVAAAPAARPVVRVPDVTGKVFVFAKGMLEDAGFAWRVTGSVGGYAANVVASQYPSAGTRVVDNGMPTVRVTLTASRSYPSTACPRTPRRTRARDRSPHDEAGGQEAGRQEARGQEAGGQEAGREEAGGQEAGRCRSPWSRSP